MGRTGELEMLLLCAVKTQRSVVAGFSSADREDAESAGLTWPGALALLKPGNTASLGSHFLYFFLLGLFLTVAVKDLGFSASIAMVIVPTNAVSISIIKCGI